jgi:hypothetical protein
VLYFAAYIVTHIDDEARIEIRAELEAKYDDRIASLEIDAKDKQGAIATGLTTDLQRIGKKADPELEQTTGQSPNPWISFIESFRDNFKLVRFVYNYTSFVI